MGIKDASSVKRFAAQSKEGPVPKIVASPRETSSLDEKEMALNSQISRQIDHQINARLDSRIDARLSAKQTSQYTSSPLPSDQPVTALGNSSPAEVADKWQNAIQKVVKAVVSIHFSSVTPFDTERTYVSEATGFVVDSSRGLIMTNRHVVGPGPFTGYIVFDNHEECSVDAIYRDPVHDFGFLRYDPSKVKHMQVESLDLCPENATVGCEIRVIGNDAGEKLSILAGVISRVDRNTPDYGEMSYNDFNTEYIQAAASASGGSSGSPVVDIYGNVVALQAGGSSVASTDFFLPLFRGKRALSCLQNGEPITRGTIQVKWVLRPYDECRRLGLTKDEELEARKRDPASIGLLVASSTLPDGPASNGVVEEGDILLSLNGNATSRFREVDEVLDSNVGRTIKMSIMRSGEVINWDEVKVQDLFGITPSRFVRVAGAVFHDLSYQISSYYAHPVKGVYIAYTGFYFNPTATEDYTGWVISELDDKPTPNLDAFIEVVTAIPNGKLVPGKFWHVAEPHAVVTSVVNVNRQWANGPQDFELAVCNNETGLWDFTPLGPGAPSEKPRRGSARFVPLTHSDATPAVAALNNSIVRVKMLRPAMIEGFTIPESQMHGFVVDAEQGLVLVSRLCVPHYLVDLTVVIADSVILPAKVVFLHPQQGYAIVQYDPQLIDAPIRSIPLASKPQSESDMLTQGTQVSFVGYDNKGSAYSVNTRIADIAPTMLPVGFAIPPRYRATNIDCIGVDSSIIPELDSGLLADPQTGVVRAIWLSFLGDINVNTRRDRMYKFAIDASTISNTIEQIKKSPFEVDPRFIDLEARTIKFATARIWKVPDHWIKRIELMEGSRLRPELLSVARVASSLQKLVQEGDILVAINGVLAINVSQLTNLPTSAETVELTIIRKGQELTITVPTTLSSETVTSTLISWCGMSVHKPHHAVLQQVKNPPSQVYVVSTHSGSPATMYDIFATSFVTHINGIETPDIDTFFNVVKSIPDNTYAKIRTVNFEGMPAAQSIRTNYHYFPTWRIDLDKVSRTWKHTK